MWLKKMCKLNLAVTNFVKKINKQKLTILRKRFQLFLTAGHF